MQYRIYGASVGGGYGDSMSFESIKKRNEGEKAAGIVRVFDIRRQAKQTTPDIKECRHLGKRIDGEPCGSPLLRCNFYGDITTRFYPCVSANRCCDGCDKKDTKVPFVSKSDDPRVGVVIGSFRWPALIDLQILVIRENCGPVPILVSNDDPTSFEELREICNRHEDLTLVSNKERIGHTGGDIAAFWAGIQWASDRGLQIAAKLSQRLIIDRARWLQDSAIDLLASGLPMSGRRCVSPSPYDLRTEAVLMDVSQWNRPEVLERIKPRRYWDDEPGGLNAETVVYRVLIDLLGGIYWPWASIMGEDRSKREQADVLWHWDTSIKEYQRLAVRHGVKLPESFHVGGWERELKAGTYAFG